MCDDLPTQVVRLGWDPIPPIGDYLWATPGHSFPFHLLREADDPFPHPATQHPSGQIVQCAR